MTETLATQIPSDYAGQRLDIVAARLFPAYSRNCLQSWIHAGHVHVDSQVITRTTAKVAGGEYLAIVPHLRPELPWQGQKIPLTLVYEDEDIIVVNKPPQLVVHPGNGHTDRTLINGLLYRDPTLAHLPRAGIVHRLDKDTSGLMVVARTLRAHQSLTQQLQARTVKRTYQALVNGLVIAGGTLTDPIGRHPQKRTQMAVIPHGREAITHFRIQRRFLGYTLLDVMLETGRTHQIRVHLSHQRWPIVGDKVYGRLLLAKGLPALARTLIQNCQRQMLHASSLTLKHPADQRTLSWTSTLPTDMQTLLESLPPA